MAKIKLTKSEFSIIPEGKHVFKVTKCTYDEDFGKLEVELTTASGQKHIERFSLINDLGEINEGAQKAFSFFAKTCLNNYNLDEIDTDDLVGRYIKAEVIHRKEPSNKDPNKTVTFINLGDKSPASGFEENVPEKKDNKLDLDALLE